MLESKLIHISKRGLVSLINGKYDNYKTLAYPW